MPLAFWRLALERLPPAVHVHCTGGEPLCYRQAPALLAAAAARGSYSLVTNGLGLTESICTALGRRPPTNVTVSLHGVAHVHDLITGVPGSHGRTVAGLERLLRHLPREAVSVNYTLLADNAGCLPEVVSFLAGLGVASLVVQGFDASVRRAGAVAGLPVGAGEPEERVDWMAARPILARLPEMAGAAMRVHLPVGWQGQFAPGGPLPAGPWTCDDLATTMRCGPEGEVYACDGRRLGSLERRSWQEIWLGVDASDFRRQRVGPSCAGCCKLRHAAESEAA